MQFVIILVFQADANRAEERPVLPVSAEEFLDLLSSELGKLWDSVVKSHATHVHMANKQVPSEQCFGRLFSGSRYKRSVEIKVQASNMLYLPTALTLGRSVQLTNVAIWRWDTAEWGGILKALLSVSLYHSSWRHNHGLGLSSCIMSEDSMTSNSMPNPQIYLPLLPVKLCFLETILWHDSISLSSVQTTRLLSTASVP